MKKSMKYYIKQLFPLKYKSYKIVKCKDGITRKKNITWVMWLGKRFNIKESTI